MKKHLLKIPALFLALLLAVPSPSLALAPVAIAAAGALSAAEMWALGASVTLHVAGAAYIVKQALFPGSSAGNGKVTPDGTIGRGATVQWVDTKDIDASGLPKVKQAPATVKINHSDLKRDILKDAASKAKYPKLSDSLQVQTNLPFSYSASTSLGLPTSVNSYVTYGGGTYKVNSYTYNTTGGCSSVCQPADASPKTYNNYPGAGYVTIIQNYNYGPQAKWVLYTSPAPAPVYVDSTPQQFANKISNSGSNITSPTDIFSDKYADIDQYIKDFPGVVSVVDGPPEAVNTAPTATLPAPGSQVGVDSKEAQATATAANQSATTAAQGAVTTAQTNYSTSPTPENAQKLADAQRELDRLKAEQAKQAADDAEDEENKEALKASGFDSETAYGNGTDFDFGARFGSFMTAMKQTAVFSLPGQFLSGIPSGGSPVVSFNGGRYGSHSYDFNSLNAVWLALKAIILVMFGWFSMRIVLKGGS